MEFNISYDEEIKPIPSFADRYTSDFRKLMKLEYHRSILGSIPADIKQNIRQELQKMENNATLIDLLENDPDVINTMIDRIEQEAISIDENKLDNSLINRIQMEEEREYMEYQAEQYEEEYMEYALDSKRKVEQEKKRLEETAEVLKKKLKLIDSLQDSQSSNKVNQFLQDQKGITSSILSYTEQESVKYE